MLIYHSKAYRIKFYITKKYREKVDVMTSFMMSFHVVSFCKMAPSKEQSKEVVKLYYESKSPVTVIRTMKRKYPELGELNKKQIKRIVQRFEATGSIEDRRHTNPGRPRSVRTDETIDRVKSAIVETPQRSVRRVLGDITNSASRSSLHRMLPYDLKLTPYTVSIMQHLKQSDVESRLSFARRMITNNDIADKIWFSDEAHFHLNAEVNKKNVRYWRTEKPNYYLEKPLHSEKITVWAAFSADGIIGPFFP